MDRTKQLKWRPIIAKSKIIFKKVTKVTEQYNALKDAIDVKYSEHSDWYKFKGVKDGMFVLAERNGETFRTNQILVGCYE